VPSTMPEAVRNAELTRTLARVLRRPSLPFGVPAFALHVALGALADETLLASARVVPARLLETGYRFQQPALEPALRHVLASESR